MWSFAWRNLLTRPLRTALALVGLSIPILGVLGLLSLSGGLRNLVGATVDQIQGVVVLRENAPSPVFSTLPPDLPEQIRQEIPGVRAVAPELWGLPPSVNGSSFIAKALSSAIKGESQEQRLQGLFDTIVISGQEIEAHQNLRSPVFLRNMIPAEEGGGRFLELRDRGTNHIIISRKIAGMMAGDDGQAKQVGDTLKIGTEEFEIIGLYDTGSMFLDVVIVMDIEAARRVLNEGPGAISDIYIEAEDPAEMDAVAQAIEDRFPGVDARSMDEVTANFGRIMGQLDLFLMMIVSLALLVGVVGIVNTMLMSTTERFSEFGILRTNGWSQRDVLTLVTAESSLLGGLAGILGCLLAALGTTIANQFLRNSGLQLTLTPTLFVLGLSLAVVMGTLGGLYPAWRAARLVPMEAIRLGAQ